MRTCLFMLAIVKIILVGPLLCPAEIVDTFPCQGEFATCGLQVGPSGDIWFILIDDQARLMRASDDAVQCVYDTGMVPSLYDITVSPDGVIWLGEFRYIYSPEAGLYESGIQLPKETSWFFLSGPGIIDANCRMFVTGLGGSEVDPGYRSCQIYEVGPGIAPELRYGQYYGGLDSILVVSATECWASYWWKGGGAGLCRINLEAGAPEAFYSGLCGAPSAKDSQGFLWLIDGPSIETFNGESLSVFAEGDERLWYRKPVLAADGAVWSAEADDYRDLGTTFFGISRFAHGQKRTFTVEDGLLSNWCETPVIDYDGRLWVANAQWVNLYVTLVGLSRISDGGWPPMRLMLNRVDTPDSISVEVQVINNGPVVGVDVYIALQMNGQLLFWPNWQLAPSPVQVNLPPGHNQTATIISAPRSSIPPGTYTFFSCMTGRNTHKLIGPLDRKFESLTIEIN